MLAILFNMDRSANSAIHARGAILLIPGELGHRPVGLVRSARLRWQFAPDVIDIAVESLDVEKVSRAQFIGISVPMHTALRLGVHLLHRIRETMQMSLYACMDFMRRSTRTTCFHTVLIIASVIQHQQNSSS